MKYLESFREMISLRGLTDHTVKSYSTYIRSYLEYLDRHDIMPEDASWDDMRSFISFLKDSRNLSDRTINSCISQLRFFTMYILHKPWDPTQLPMRKFDQYLPYVPSQDEVLTFISTLPDLKEKAMICLLYSSGLRVGEVCRLRYDDVSRKDMRIHITHSKNRSDRYAILSQNALDILTQYWRAYDRPRGWLFPKANGGDGPIDTFYVTRHINAHEARLGWAHRITPHTLRHAFATHLYENGTDLLTIKTLLGHRSINSTTIYITLANTTLSKVSSPFDLKGGVR